MATVASGVRATYAAYLAAEAASDVRHEYLRGEIFAMSGGTPEHAALALAVGREIGNALVGRKCRAYSADMRVRVLETDLATYPDVSVVCDKLQTDPGDANAAINPTVIVEVLSDSTEAYDRGAKAAHYRRIPSLREYVLVSQREPLVEVQRRNDEGVWEIHEFRATQSVELRSLGVMISVDAIYADPLGG